MRILIPALERDHYNDLVVLMTSLNVYAPEIPVTIAYKGRRPRVFGADLIEQPEDAQHFGHACRFLLNSTKDEELVFLNDDTVIMPDTFTLLAQDVAAIETQLGQRVGIVGLRSNFVAGYQNIRIPQPTDRGLQGLRFPSEQQVLAVDQVFGIGFYVRRSILGQITREWTDLHWYSDNLLCFDLKRRGFRCFVSRGYIHHIGSRSGGTQQWEKWDQEAKAWIMANRPDFAEALGWSASPSTSPPIITASSSTDTDLSRS